MDASVRRDHVLVPQIQLQFDAFRSSPTTMNQSDKNTKQYWYPNMGNADIIDALDGWGLSITHHQLVKPTPDFVLNVYGACLEKVVGLNEDSLQESVQSALASLEESSTVRSFGRLLMIWAHFVAGHVQFRNEHQLSRIPHVCSHFLSHISSIV